MANQDNVCLFPPAKQKSDNIRIINFVRERHAERYPGFSVKSSYILYLVSEGRGVLHTLGGDHELQKGTLFFTFPAKPHRIESTEALEYIYVSFIGLSAIPLMERLGVDNGHPVYPGFDSLISFWQESLEASDDGNNDLTALSVLYATLARIHSAERRESEEKNPDLMAKLVDYIDSRYYDCSLCLNVLAEAFSYNAKYISRLFKKAMGVGYTDYLRSVRIRHACSLMNEGITDVKDISWLVGFSDPLYFSRIFKIQMGVPPTRHLAEIKKARGKRV